MNDIEQEIQRRIDSAKFGTYNFSVVVVKINSGPDGLADKVRQDIQKMADADPIDKLPDIIYPAANGEFLMLLSGSYDHEHSYKHSTRGAVIEAEERRSEPGRVAKMMQRLESHLRDAPTVDKRVDVLVGRAEVEPEHNPNQLQREAVENQQRNIYTVTGTFPKPRKTKTEQFE